MQLEEYIIQNKLDLLNYKDNIKAHQFASEIDAANWEGGLDIGKWLSDAPEQHKRIDWMISMCCGSVLDIGCGNGMVTNFIIAQPHINKDRVVGLNLSKRELKYANKWGTKSKFVCGICEKLPFKDETFDCIVCGEIIEHIVNPENLLSECKRVLKNGTLILTTPHIEKQWHVAGVPNPLHVREYDDKSLRALLENNGFKSYATLSGSPGEIFEYDYCDSGQWRKRIVKRSMGFVYAVGVKV